MADALSLAKSLKNREVTSVSLVEQAYQAIAETDGDIKAYLTLTKESAMAQAQSIDKRLDQGEELPLLAGIPIGIKDNILLKGFKTTCASKMLENFVAPYDATVIEKINAQGLIPVGKLNMDEFAMGSSTQFSAFQVTRNPRNLDYVPGGSSGGSAATVSANQVPLSLGSDTGGSIRQPASFCGIVGLKPTYGRVSRYGLVSFASSLDQIGPMATTVGGAAALLNVISGFDSKDSTSEQVEVPDFTQAIGQSVSGKRIGVPKVLMGDAVDPQIRKAIDATLADLVAKGATWEVVDFGCMDEALSVYYILAPAEASSNLERYDGVRYGHRKPDAANLNDMYTRTRGEGFGPEVKRRIILGTYVLSSGYYDAYYLKAQKVRSLVIKAYQKAFESVDVILSPTVPSLPFKLGENLEDPIAMYLQDIATIPANLAGLPAISVPCGTSSEGLPIGVQITGKAFDEMTVLSVADAIHVKETL
ncbi:Asp-tRNA(Asn)/Glu-tRNA(Gln) amidotransferase subunit GatA [bacterium]|jgi:aspartyl-tRNA(Asn)/glutamyl-tRNA(Gln) amidotransferase subunit A|nr:Asp-tRNA(Asn)/Glu-tRNA(Gln) amidotransferase subunit GatA [bacterium]